MLAVAEPGGVQIAGGHGSLDRVDGTSLLVDLVQVGDLMKCITFKTHT